MSEVTMNIEFKVPLQHDSPEHGIAWDYDAGWIRVDDVRMAFTLEVFEDRPRIVDTFREHSPTVSALDQLRDYLRRNRGFQVTSHETPNPLRNWRGEVMTDAERLERQRRMYVMWRTP